MHMYVRTRTYISYTLNTSTHLTSPHSITHPSYILSTPLSRMHPSPAPLPAPPLQGVAIFVFYVLRNEMMLPLWRKCCPCCMKTVDSSPQSTKRSVWTLTVKLSS